MKCYLSSAPYYKCLLYVSWQVLGELHDMHDCIYWSWWLVAGTQTYWFCLCFICNRPLISEYGLWDEVRVDQGKEWVLSLFVQEQMTHLRTNTTRPPHLQSTCTSKTVCVNCTVGIICLHIHSWMDGYMTKQYWLVNTFASTLALHTMYTLLWTCHYTPTISEPQNWEHLGRD